jgi:hypothetical protein
MVTLRRADDNYRSHVATDLRAFAVLPVFGNNDKSCIA